MKRLLLLALLLLPALPAVAEDAAVEKGVAQVREGDLEAAVDTLGSAVVRLAADPARSRDLARAHAYLGNALLALGHEQLAVAHFADVWKADPGFQPSASEFPPRVLKALDAARGGHVAAPAGAPPASAASTPALLWLYRPKRFTIGHFKIEPHLDYTHLATLEDNRYISLWVAPGPHALNTIIDVWEDTVHLDLEAGSTYFVRLRAADTPTLVESIQARTEMALMQPEDRTHVAEPTVSTAPFSQTLRFDPARDVVTSGDDHGRVKVMVGRPPARGTGTPGLVWVYRPEGGGGSPQIVVDDEVVAFLENGRYLAIDLPPGRHVFRTKLSSTPFEMTLTPGGVAYVEMWADDKGRESRLEPVSADRARLILAGLKPSKKEYVSKKDIVRLVKFSSGGGF